MSNELQHALSVLASALESSESARRRSGLTCSGFDKAVQEGRAPAPIKIGRDRHFVRSEIDAWLAQRAAVRVPTPALVENAQP